MQEITLSAIDKVHERLKDIPLKQMDGTMLTLALMSDVDDTFNPRVRMLIRNTLDLATYLHRNQTRANRASLPRTPYIEHPLRNTLRMMRWGIRDEALIVSTIIHDIAEDCAKELIDLVGVEPTGNMRTDAIEAVRRYSNQERIAYIVDGVTNYPSPAGLSKDEKRKNYAVTVTEKIKDLDIFIVKLVDFFDNANSLVHNVGHSNEAMINHLAMKYLPMFDVFIEQLNIHIKENKNPVICEALNNSHDEITRSLKRAKKDALKILEIK